MPKRKRKVGEAVVVHDHFDGSAHCVQCGGDCRLTGAERLLTDLVRSLLEREAMFGGVLYWLGYSAFERHGIDWQAMLVRAKLAADGIRDNGR